MTRSMEHVEALVVWGGTDCPDMPMSENPSGSAQSRTRRREGRPRPTLPMTGRSLGLGESTTGHGASGANGSLNADSRVVSPCLLVGPPLVECRKRYPLEDHVAGYIDCWNPPRRSVTIQVAGVGWVPRVAGECVS